MSARHSAYWGTYERSMCHVSDSDRTVIRKARGRLSPVALADKSPATRERRKHFYRMMIACHHDWQQTCRELRM